MQADKIEITPPPEHCWPYGQRMVVQLTLNCPLKCRHCVVNADHHRTEELSEETAAILHSELSHCPDVKALSITGGEPFTRLKRLEEFSALAEDHDLNLYVVTSAFWAHTQRHASRVLDRLAGTTQLNISTGVFHTPYVPLSHTRNAALAALEKGMAVTFRIFSQGDVAFLEQIAGLFDEEARERMEFMPMPVQTRGRAIDLQMHGMDERTPLPQLAAVCCGGISSPFVMYDGTVTACNGFEKPDRRHPLTLGNIRQRPLGQILSDADRNFFIHALRLWGPRGIIDCITDKGGSPGLQEHYSVHDVCELCFDICDNPGLMDDVMEKLNEPERQREIALGRALRYGEQSMLGSTCPLPSS